MSVSGISASSLSGYTAEVSFQQIQQAMQQLASDLQSNNLTAAQTDFVTLQQELPDGGDTSSSQNNDPLAQAFKQLAKDIQSGILPPHSRILPSSNRISRRSAARLRPAVTPSRRSFNSSESICKRAI